MENSPKNDLNSLINQMQMIKFQGVFTAALDLLKKQPVLLIGLFVGPMILNALIRAYLMQPILSTVSYSNIGSRALIEFVFSIISVVIGLLGSGLLLRAAGQTFEGKNIDLKELISFVEKNILDAVRLVIKLFIFTGAWIIWAFSLATALLFFVAPALSGMLLLLSPLLVIAYIIMFFKKIIGASMAFSVFWSSGEPVSPDAAIKKSLELAEGLTMTIFGNYLAMGVLSIVVSIILSPVFVAIFSLAGTFGVELSTALVGGLLGTVSVLFQYCLKGQIEKFRHTAGHHNTHSA